MDVLADVLSATRVGGTIFSSRYFIPPFGMRFPPAMRAGFHIVVQGQMWLRVHGLDEPLLLRQGDVVLLPHGAGHSLASELDAEIVPFAECMAGQSEIVASTVPELTPGASKLMCGVYHFERDSMHPLLALLPPVILIPAHEGKVAGPLESVLHLLASEQAQSGPGGTAVVSRLVDVLFIYIIRAWVETRPESTTGWLGALRDPQIGRALTAIHRNPDQDWTVDSLAAEVGMSRSAFVRRFRHLVGEPPLGYLTRWRMDVAARLLRETDRPMAQIAGRVGYQSEYAFNRAFQRARGLPPGRYRESSRALLAA